MRLTEDILPFTTGRRFVISGYLHSMGVLVLRSTIRHGSSGTRMDILFQDTKAISLPSFMDDVVVSEGTADLATRFGSGPMAAFDLEFGIKVFTLGGQDWSGLVIAGSAFVLEDELDDLAPTGLLGPFTPQSNRAD